jgi:hypothetical protein
MIARFRATFAAILLSIGAAPSGAWAQDSGPMTRDDFAVVEAQIAQNLNIDPAVFQQCGKIFELATSLAADGTVTSVDLPSDADPSPACSTTMQAARRAILLASPFKSLAGRELTQIRLRFDPKNFPE